jgi:hypothetical protein
MEMTSSQRGRCLSLLLWVVSAALLSSTVEAQRRRDPKHQEKGSDNAEYRGLIDAALSEFDSGNWNEALALFQRAHAVEPNARTLRGIGFCLFELRRYVAAVQHLEQAMVDARTPLSAAQRTSTQQVLDRAKAFVAHVKVRLSPEAALLLVDGQQVSATASELELDPGEHELSASADSFAARSLHVVLQSGVNEPIVLELAPLPQAGPAPVAAAHTLPVESASAPSSDRIRLKRGLLIAGAALAGAGLIAGTVTGVLTIGQKNELEKSCPDDRCPADKSGDLDRANRFALASTLSLVAAGVGVGIGLTGLLLPRSDKRSTAARSAIRLTLGPSSVAVNGRF